MTTLRHLPACFNLVVWRNRETGVLAVSPRSSRLYACPACCGSRIRDGLTHLDDITAADPLYLAKPSSPDLGAIRQMARRKEAGRLLLRRLVSRWGQQEYLIVTDHPSLSPRKKLFRPLPRQVVRAYLWHWCVQKQGDQPSAQHLPVMERAEFLGPWKRPPQPDRASIYEIIGEGTPVSTKRILAHFGVSHGDSVDAEEASEIKNFFDGHSTSEGRLLRKESTDALDH